jgi:hypothetical protein
LEFRSARLAPGDDSHVYLDEIDLIGNKIFTPEVMHLSVTMDK